MTEVGYWLSSEEHAPIDLVRYARRAEQAGFTYAMISDHYHPWIDRQGQSSFVWSVIGAIAHATERLHLATGVTCPIIRIHPAIIAHAAATAAAMMPGRFSLGVGTGENLNEHILGGHWPPYEVRQEMLEEAIEVIRKLWKGGLQSHRGRYYTVENARVYTLPNEPPSILVAASGPSTAEVAGRIGDGLIGVSADKEVIGAFDRSGGAGKPRHGQFTVCWAQTEEEAVQTAYEWWPNAALKGALFTELPLPSHFEDAASLASPDDVAKAVVCGPDPERHIAIFREYEQAGYTQIYIHQIGPDQEGFFRFYEREVLPSLL